MAEFAAPPSYDDVVPQTSSVQPSAPPRTHITTGSQSPVPYVPYPERPSSSTSGQRRRSGPTSRQGNSPKLESCIDRYITYSIARHLRKYMEPEHNQQDPELDVEAEFGRNAVRTAQMAIAKKRRLQCISGWLWCFGVILILVYLALPVAMIIIGAFGIGNCPYRSGTLFSYLIGGGMLLVILITLRLIPSVMTCIRNRDYCSTRKSSVCGGCICSIEVLFYVALILNFIALILGTYTTFAEAKPSSCPDPPASSFDCCDPFLFLSTAILTVFQYVLYAITGLFVCLVLCCIRSMDKKMTQ